MDFDGAIQAHTYWKVRLLLYARGKAAEKIDLQTLRKDNVCAGYGEKYAVTDIPCCIEVALPTKQVLVGGLYAASVLFVCHGYFPPR